MPTYETRFLQRDEIAEGTMAFYFARPPGFAFRAGQAVVLTLIEPTETDAKGPRRTFSIASAPSEDAIMIATRMRGTAFKRTLKSLPRSAPVRLQGPIGKFTLDAEVERPAVMLAGGIGITPFRSMLRQAADENQRRKLYLFYSNRTPQSAPFLAELTELARRNPHFLLSATMTDPNVSAEHWDGTRGYIGEDMLRQTLGDLLQPIYYVAGPPRMVAAMQGMLTRASVAAAQIRKDEFFGY
jgi:ferredoxin-NADP reductase